MVQQLKVCLHNRRIEIIQILGILGLSGCSLLVSPDVKRGDQHLAAERWEEASLAYKQALKDNPFDPSLQGKYALARERAAATFAEHGRALLKERQIDLAL